MKWLLVLSVIVLSGCATIIKGQSQSIQLTGGQEDGSTKVSMPTGIFQLNGGQTTVSLLRTKADIPIQVTCNGVTQNAVIKTQFDMGWGGLGNIIFGGIPGWIIDGVGDKAYDAPAQFNVGPYCGAKEPLTTVKK